MEIRCSNLKLEFHDFFQESLFDIWKWKLDPWKFNFPVQSMEKMSKIEIDCNKNYEVEKKPDCIVYEENSGFFKHQVSQLQTGETLWELIRVAKNQCELQFLVSANWEKMTLLQDCTNTDREIAFEYIGRMLPGVFLQHEILSFHGALLEHNGEGIIISAPSGTGKTTHARLWRDFEHALIINGDYTTVYKDKTGWYGFGIPWSGTSGEAINRSIKIKALVILERFQVNSVHQLAGLEAFGLVLPHVKYPQWDKNLTSDMLTLLDGFLEDIPVIKLQCRPDRDAVVTLKNMIENS